MKLRDIMTKDVKVISPDASLKECAKLMDDVDVGAIPVCDNDRLKGIITDRDIVIRAVSDGQDPNQVKVRDAMTSPIIYSYDDEDVHDAAKLMEEKQIRRLVVLDRNKRMCGICSLGDIAVETHDRSLSGEVTEKVSEHVKGKAA